MSFSTKPYLQNNYGVTDPNIYIQKTTQLTFPPPSDVYNYGDSEGSAFPLDGVRGYFVYLDIPGDFIIHFDGVDYIDVSSNEITLDVGWNLLGFTHNGVPWTNIPRAKDFATGVIDPDLDIAGPLTKIIVTKWTTESQLWFSYVYTDIFPCLESKNWAWDFSYSYQPGNGFNLYVDQSIVLNFPVDY